MAEVALTHLGEGYIVFLVHRLDQIHDVFRFDVHRHMRDLHNQALNLMLDYCRAVYSFVCYPQSHRPWRYSTQVMDPR